MSYLSETACIGVVNLFATYWLSFQTRSKDHLG